MNAPMARFSYDFSPISVVIEKKWYDYLYLALPNAAASSTLKANRNPSTLQEFMENMNVDLKLPADRSNDEASEQLTSSSVPN